ncbi:transportin-3-like [Halichondria panicea]|uniref:transportin-3-like n=1 Tax=Halichondria panicea TaxID=6063 RepID=UPI00312B7964
MEKPSLDVVLQALDTLYSNKTDIDPTHKAQANQWLIQLTQSVHAWEVADQLLLLNRDIVTSQFAAQTMQSKVRYAFHELPPNTHTALRDSLLNHLTLLCEAPTLVVRQVAMALADLALLMGTWTTVIDDLVQRFGSHLSTVRVLLDVLIILPEEINNRYLHLGQNKRKQLTELLSASSSQVVGVLCACLGSCGENEEIATRMFACLGSWAQLRGFSEDMLAGGGLLAALFNTLNLLNVNERLYDAITDTLCSLLYMCEDVDKYPQLSLELKMRVLALLPVYQAAVTSEDQDRAYSLCRVFTELAESLLMYVVQHPGSDLGDLAMLDLLLECAQHPDYEVAEITFNVWFRIGEELLRLNDSAHSAIFKPYVQRLVSALCVHCQLEEDTDKTKVPDESDDFSGFRDNVVELIRDTVFLFGSLNCFAELYANICKPGTAWNITESCLLVMYAVAPSIRSDESEVLPFAVPVLLSMAPSTHYAVRATTLALVAQLAGWINKHPDTLETVLTFIHTSLQLPAVASQAANAIQSVCNKCRSRMGQHYTGLVQIIEAADRLGIKNESIVGLLKAVTEILSEMDSSSVGQGLLSLTTMISKPLTLVGVDGNVDVCVCVDRLAAVFRACSIKNSSDTSHPAKAAMTQLWPLLNQVLNTYQTQVKVIERTCRCVRFMLRCSSVAACDLLTDIVSTAISLYSQHRQSCYLYLGSIIVDEYGRQGSYQEGLATMLGVLATTSLPLLAGPTGLVEHPDTIDDLFRLCARYLQRCPVVFLQSSVVATVTQCGLACSTLGHRDAFSSVMKYFRDLLHLPQQEATSDAERQLCVSTVEAFLTEQGQALIDGLVSGFVSLRSFMTVESCEVLWEMLTCAKEHTCGLLSNALARLPETTRAEVTEDQRSEFIHSVATCKELDDLYPLIKRLTRLYH